MRGGKVISTGLMGSISNIVLIWYLPIVRETISYISYGIGKLLELIQNTWFLSNRNDANQFVLVSKRREHKDLIRKCTSPKVNAQFKTIYNRTHIVNMFIFYFFIEIIFCNIVILSKRKIPSYKPSVHSFGCIIKTPFIWNVYGSGGGGKDDTHFPPRGYKYYTV